MCVHSSTHTHTHARTHKPTHTTHTGNSLRNDSQQSGKFYLHTQQLRMCVSTSVYCMYLSVGLWSLMQGSLDVWHHLMTGEVLEAFGQYCLYEVTNTVCDRYCMKILFTFVATYVCFMQVCTINMYCNSEKVMIEVWCTANLNVVYMCAICDCFWE